METQHRQIASIVMAAGRGSRMKGYSGNKTLLPLVSDGTEFSGQCPILLHLLENIPKGPRAIVVNHCKEDVMRVAGAQGAMFCEQAVLNGTGGAILAAQPFIEETDASRILITMGDVPFVKKDTYAKMAGLLDVNDLVVLGFCPEDKKQYGVLEIVSQQVRKITEWKYWKEYPAVQQAALTVCNAGIYAVTRKALQTYIPVMASRPQTVHKEVGGRMKTIEEFFITDLVEYMVQDGRPVGYLVVDDPVETMGVDDVAALRKAQRLYQMK